MFPEWTWIVGLFIGAAIGSFLNVVIYRVPRNISLSKPAKSFCPICKHSLGVLDLFPLLSYVMLGGKCRYCKAKVPIRYFFVELINGAIWAGLWYQHLVVGWDPAKAVAYALAGSTLVAIIYIDWELFIIPDQINGFLLLVGLGYNVWLYFQGSERAFIGGLPSSLVGALVGIGALWGIAFLGRIAFKKNAMGHGDIKMARGIGAVLLPLSALISFGLAVVLGAVLGIVQIVARRSKIEEGDEQVDITDEFLDEPESIGSLVKSGIGYVLCIDLIGLLIPSLYRSWFNEDPYEPIVETDDTTVMDNTIIPFGPYLALGAIVTAVFEQQLMQGVEAYWKHATGAQAFLEQLTLGGRL